MNPVLVERSAHEASLTVAGETLDDRWRRLAEAAEVSLTLVLPGTDGDGIRLSAGRLDLGPDDLRRLAQGQPLPPGPTQLDPATLARREAEEVEARKLALLQAGVYLIGGGPSLVGPRVQVEAGAVLGPHTSLLGRTRICAHARVDQGCHVVDSWIGPRAHLRPYTVTDGAHLEPGASAGPFAHLRQGTHLGPASRVGNFVETKNARLDAEVKAGHLTYLGDCEVGARTNIGAGTITCNYDGLHKHPTTIGAEVFIGSHTALVAPVQVGAGALIGAGSTITEDVDDGALALARARQTSLPGRGARLQDARRARSSGSPSPKPPSSDGST